MKYPGKAAADGKLKGSVIALAITWDGARWPVRTLPPKARAFLMAPSLGAVVPSARKLAELFAGDQVREIRVCWVPRLKGGDSGLSEPFQTPAGMRLSFRPTETVRFGHVLGVIYRRN